MVKRVWFPKQLELCKSYLENIKKSYFRFFSNWEIDTTFSSFQKKLTLLLVLLFIDTISFTGYIIFSQTFLREYESQCDFSLEICESEQV